MTMLADVPAALPEPGLISEDELTALALAADPDQPLDAGAVPWTMGGTGGAGLLPDWYMPAPVRRQREPWQVAVVVTLIVAFLVINGLGLCITYGHLVPA